MRVYIGCGLTHVPRDRFDDYVAFIHQLAAELRAHPHNHEVRYALVDSDPQLASKPYDDRAQLCYLWDRRIVQEAELLIAEASHPSLGLGIELQIAEQAGIPIIIAFQRLAANKSDPALYRNPDLSEHSLQIGEGYVSLMALGIPSVTRVIGYHTTADGLPAIIETVATLDRQPAGR
jgi:hypothetical protein